MPKITIYVPDDLKARMDRADGQEPAPNWSALAQEAFNLECDRADNRKKGAGKMNAMVERLKKSKQRVANEDKASGHKAGMDWAANSAEYDELVRLRDLRDSEGWFVDENAFRHVVEVIQDDGVPSHDEAGAFWEEHDDTGYPSNDFIEGFVEGACEAFAAVEDKLD